MPLKCKVNQATSTVKKRRVCLFLAAIIFCSSSVPTKRAEAELMSFVMFTSLGIGILSDLMGLSTTGADTNAQVLLDNREALRSLHKRLNTVTDSIAVALNKLDRIDKELTGRMTSALNGKTKHQLLSIVFEFNLQRTIADRLDELGVLKWRNPISIRQLLERLTLLHGEVIALDDTGLPIILIAMNTERIMRSGLGENEEAIQKRIEAYYKRLDQMLDVNRPNSLVQQYRIFKQLRLAFYQSISSRFNDIEHRLKILEELHPIVPRNCGQEKIEKKREARIVTITTCYLKNKFSASSLSYSVVNGIGQTLGKKFSPEIWSKWLSKEERKKFAESVARMDDYDRELVKRNKEFGTSSLYLPIAYDLQEYYIINMWATILSHWIKVVRALTFYRPGSYAQRWGVIDLPKRKDAQLSDFKTIHKGRCSQLKSLSDEDCIDILTEKFQSILSRPAGEWFAYNWRCVQKEKEMFWCNENRTGKFMRSR